MLLFLAGGPGGTELGFLRKFNSALEDHFTVVSWEQGGAGKSWPLMFLKQKLRPDQFVSDGLELTDYLRKRFNQDKIYLVGHSGGTIWGIRMLQEHPEWFRAYVGVAQMVKPAESDRLGYEDLVRRAETDGKADLVKRLKANGPPPYTKASKYMSYLMPQNGYMAAEERASGGAPYIGDPRDMLGVPEYSRLDKIGTVIGLARTFSVVYPQLQQVDFTKQAAELDVPIYLVEGRYDLNNWAPLVEHYCGVLKAPYKQLVWFERTGHNTCYEDAPAFNRLMIETVLPGGRETDVRAAS